MQAPSTTRVWVRAPSLKMPPSAASAWCSKWLGSSVASEGGDHPGFVHIAQVGADRAAPQAEMLRRLGADAQATSTPQASPPRGQELPVEAPDRVTVVDLLHRRVHRDEPTQVHPPAPFDASRRSKRWLRPQLWFTTGSGIFVEPERRNLARRRGRTSGPEVGCTAG